MQPNQQNEKATEQSAGQQATTPQALASPVITTSATSEPSASSNVTAFQQSAPENYHEPATNVLAILSLIFAFFCVPAGLVLGIVALKKIKKTNEKGRGLAIAGTVISSVLIVAYVVWTILVALAFRNFTF